MLEIVGIKGTAANGRKIPSSSSRKFPRLTSDNNKRSAQILEKKQTVAGLPIIKTKPERNVKHNISSPKLQSKPLVLTSSIPTTTATTPKDKAMALLHLPSIDGSNGCGAVRLKFNHYNKSFPIHNGVLKWSDVDAEYAFSFVYKGNYRRDLIPITSPTPNTLIFKEEILSTSVNSNIIDYITRDTLGDYFLDLINDQQYLIEIEEDPEAGIGAEGLRLNNEPLLLSNPSNVLVSTNRAMNHLTNELKSMKTTELQSKEALDILERRDLEDILYNRS
eukprot:gene8617-17779_t